MCSRYSLTSPPDAIRAYFGTDNAIAFPPRYNIAPMQPVAIVRQGLSGKGREIVLVRWGLIPSWVKDPRTFSTLVNARAETLLEKPSFRAALRHKRCLVPADGFYEWMGPAGRKRPFLIRPRAGGPMALAAIYEHWLGAEGSELESMAIITTTANRVVGAIHDRMPAILAPDQFETWLDVRRVDAKEAAELVGPAPDDLLEAIEVDPKVNNPRNEGPELQHPVRATLI